MRIPVIIAIIFACCPIDLARAMEGPTYLAPAPYSVEIVNEYGVALPTFAGQGRTYVLGTLGQRYLVRVRNRSGQRIEVVASVDGLDVLDGRPAAFSKRGYVVNAYEDVTIDGYRLSGESVAAFRFSSVPQSYAAQMGSARDVGVIGVAVFPERYLVPHWPTPLRRDRAVPAPEKAEPGAAEGGMESGVPGGLADGSAGSTDELRRSEEAPAAPNSGAISKKPMSPSRPGLGTEFGEEHASHVYAVRFERASSTPAAVLTVHYNDRAGLIALGINVDGGAGWYSGQDGWLRETAEPFRRNASFAQPPPGWPR
jgi:hypothetical protein